MTSKKAVFFVILTILCINLMTPLASLPQTLVEAQEVNNGSITLQPNVIPDLNITARPEDKPESFRFEWLGNKFDIELFFNATKVEPKKENVTKLWSLQDFEDDFNVTVNYAVNRSEFRVQFGWVIDDVENISDLVHNAWFKIEDSSFDYGEIELEEIEVWYEEEPYNITRFNLPDNLVLSFEDLYHKGFVIGHQNKTATSIKGFSDKSSWDLDPITYSSNIITAIGGSSGTPLNFNDLWVADKGGTQELLAKTQAGNHTLTTQVRPTDNKSIPLDIVASELTVVGWCNLTGTEKDDSTQTENITVSTNQTYTTSEYWKTVTYINCSGTWNITVQQNQWGEVWKTSSTQYTFDAKIYIGNGTSSGETWFNDTAKEITFNDIDTVASEKIIWVRRYSHFTMGEVLNEDKKTTGRGIQFISLLDYTTPSYHSPCMLIWQEFTPSDCYLYGCSIISAIKDRGVNIWMYYANNRMWNCYLYRMGLRYINGFNNVHVKSGIAYTFPLGERFYFYEKTNYFFYTHFGYNFVAVEIYARNNAEVARLSGSWSGTGSMTNCDIDIWTFSWSGTCTGEIYREYEFDLTMYFKNGTQAENANVTITNDYLGTSDSWLTYANGSILTQTYSYGHYNQTGGDTIYDYNPYNLTVTLDGYETYTDLINITQKENLRIALCMQGDGDGGGYLPLGILIGLALTFCLAPIFALMIIKSKNKKQQK